MQSSLAAATRLKSPGCSRVGGGANKAAADAAAAAVTAAVTAAAAGSYCYTCWPRCTCALWIIERFIT